MSIVVITIPGRSKIDFVNDLYERTGGGVKLVIIQKPKNFSFFESVERLYKNVGLKNFFKELWYALLLRFDSKKVEALDIFRMSSNGHLKEKNSFIPKVLETESVNSDRVYRELRNISPSLLVIWGSNVVKPYIINSAKKAINLHMGKCPEYRGAVANQFAFLNNDFKNIGATIHYVEEKVDSGEILAQIVLDEKLSLKEAFCKLNDEARKIYLDIAERLYKGEILQSAPQEISKGRNVLLKEWVPSIRYKVAEKVIKYQKQRGR